MVSEPTAYLLGELDPAEAAAFERAMAADAKLRDEVERLRPVVTRLQRLPADAWESPEPPPLKLPADALAGGSAGEASGAPRRSRRRLRPAVPRRLVLRPLAAAACAVVLLAAGVGLGAWLDRDPAPSEQLALRPVGDLDPSASGKVSLLSDGVNVRVSGLKPTGGDEFYELWLLGADKRLVGLGSFRVDDDGAATLRLPLPVDPKSFTYFDLSLEPTDGDPGHSGVSVLRGPSVS
jgi:anti-sigma-K factor RskA